MRGHLQSKYGHTCCSNKINQGLHIAVNNEDLKWVKTFLVCPKLNVNVHNKDGWTVLNLATKRGLKEIVEFLLRDLRIDVNRANTGQRQNAILLASENGHVDILKILVFHPQTFVNQIDLRGRTALSVATETEKRFIIYKLLLRCPKTSVSGEFIESIKNLPKLFRHEMEHLINRRAELIELSATCCLNAKQGLNHAAWVGDFRAIRGLLECPGMESNINTIDKKGRTPLYIASMVGQLQNVKVLLNNRNVNLNIGAKLDGSTAFSIASEKAHFEIMYQLISHGKSDYDKGWCSDNWAHSTHCGKKHEQSQVASAPVTASEIGK